MTSPIDYHFHISSILGRSFSSLLIIQLISKSIIRNFSVHSLFVVTLSFDGLFSVYSSPQRKKSWNTYIYVVANIQLSIRWIIIKLLWQCDTHSLFHSCGVVILKSFEIYNVLDIILQSVGDMKHCYELDYFWSTSSFMSELKLYKYEHF